MDVQWSAWVIVAVIFYGIAIAAGCGAWSWVKYKGKGRGLRAIAFLLSMLVVAAGFNALTYGVSSGTNSENPPKVTSLDVASTGFGLDSEKEYPLLLGSRVAGGGPTVYAYKAYFSPRNTSNSSNLSVSFTAPDGASYILELPVDRIKFVPNEDAKQASVVMFLTNPTYDNDHGGKELSYDGPCTTVIESGYLTCRHVVEWKTVVSQQSKDAGLPTIVSKTFVRAIITLPSADYRAILGVRESG